VSRRALALALLALQACACVSTVSVEKATPASTGVRFNLPEVFIQVIPKADGTYELRKHFIPDPEQEYVVNTTSVFGNYTIDIKRGANNLLESVSFDSDTTALAKQAIGTAATLRAAEIEASAARAKADAADAKAAEDKALAALEGAEKAEREAAVALKVAEGKRELLAKRNTTGPDDALFQAQVAVAEARVRHDAAKENLAELRLRHKAPPPIDRAAIPPGVLQFYRVRMTGDSVQLHEMSTAPKP